MANLADSIEKFILRRLARDKANRVILNRNDLAEELACAPSQISYVVSTRFTVDRGYLVESRRGSGGFIRIERSQVTEMVYDVALTRVSAAHTEEEIEELLEQLQAKGLVSRRETAVIMQSISAFYGRMDDEERAHFIRSILSTLANLSREEL